MAARCASANKSAGLADRGIALDRNRRAAALEHLLCRRRPRAGRRPANRLGAVPARHRSTCVAQAARGWPTTGRAPAPTTGGVAAQVSTLIAAASPSPSGQRRGCWSSTYASAPECPRLSTEFVSARCAAGPARRRARFADGRRAAQRAADRRAAVAAGDAGVRLPDGAKRSDASRHRAASHRVRSGGHVRGCRGPGRRRSSSDLAAALRRRGRSAAPAPSSPALSTAKGTTDVGDPNPLDALSPVKRALLEVREMRAKLDRIETSAPGRADRHRRHRLPVPRRRDARGVLAAAARRRRRDRRGAAATAGTSTPYFDADPDAPGKMYTPSRRLPRPASTSSIARFFGISPREAATHGSAAAAAARGRRWEALEHAGIAARSLVGHARPACSSASARATTCSSSCDAATADAHRRVRRARAAPERRRRPPVVRPRPAGAEHGGRHRLLVVARRGPSRLPEPATRRVRPGARRRRQPDAAARSSRSTSAARACWRPTAAARRSTRRPTATSAARAAASSCSSGCRDARRRRRSRSSRVIRGIGGQPGRPQQRPDRAERAGAGGGASARRSPRAGVAPARRRLRRGARHRHVARRSDRGAGARRACSARARGRPTRCSSARSRRTSATSRRRPASPA